MRRFFCAIVLALLPQIVCAQSWKPKSEDCSALADTNGVHPDHRQAFIRGCVDRINKDASYERSLFAIEEFCIGDLDRKGLTGEARLVRKRDCMHSTQPLTTPESIEADAQNRVTPVTNPRYPKLGIGLQDRGTLGRETIYCGVVVKSVSPGSIGEAIGLKPGDEIANADDEEIMSSNHFVAILNKHYQLRRHEDVVLVVYNDATVTVREIRLRLEPPPVVSVAPPPPPKKREPPPTEKQVIVTPAVVTQQPPVSQSTTSSYSLLIASLLGGGIVVGAFLVLQSERGNKLRTSLLTRLAQVIAFASAIRPRLARLIDPSLSPVNAPQPASVVTLPADARFVDGAMPPKPKHPRLPINLGFGFGGGYFSGNAWILWGLIGLTVLNLAMPGDPKGTAIVVIPLAFITWCYWAWYERRSEWMSRWREARIDELMARPVAPFTPPPLDRPPTPTEKKVAVDLMRQAREAMDTAYEKDGAPFGVTAELVAMRLAKGAENIQKAQALDPAATYTHEDKDGSVTFTLDWLAAELCYWESKVFLRENDNTDEEMFVERVKEGRVAAEYRLNKQIWVNNNKALDAAERAVQYMPRTARFLIHLCNLYRANNQWAKAKAIADRVKEADPDSVETYYLMENFK